MAVALADDHDGWLARLELVFARRNGSTVLSENSHFGPLRLQRPLYPESGVCHACILHPPGGVVGGDRLEIHAAVACNAAALLTTPGATKFYRSNGQAAVQQTCLDVAANGCLEWLPQESIVYPGTDAGIRTRIDLAKEAGFVGWEVLCLGLPGCGRPFGDGRLESCFEIRREGRPIFQDRLGVAGGLDLKRPAGLRGRSVCATFIAVGGRPEMLPALRQMAASRPALLTGITLMGDLLVARCLGDASSEAKAFFQELWAWLRPRLFGRRACPPRIWET